MKNEEKTELCQLIRQYTEHPPYREKILSFFLRYLSPIIEQEFRFSKLSGREIRSEAIMGILRTFETYAEAEKPFEAIFLDHFRRGIRKASNRKKRVYDEIEETHADPNPNPEEAYAQKELINLAVAWLNKHYDPITVDYIIRHYGYGDTFTSLAEEDSKARKTVSDKVNRAYKRLQVYMKRISNEG